MMRRLQQFVRLGGLLVCLAVVLAAWPSAVSTGPRLGRMAMSAPLLDEPTPTMTNVPPTRDPPDRPTRIPPTIPPTMIEPTVAAPTATPTAGPPTVAPPTATPVTVALPVVADTYTDAFTPDTAHGNEGRLYVRADDGGWTMAVYLSFDLDAIPVGAVVHKATLCLDPIAGGARPLVMTVGPASCPFDDSLTWRQSADRGCARLQPGVEVIVEGREPLAIDVTAIVSVHASGLAQVHGLLLDTLDAGNTTNVTVGYASSEWAESDARPPRLAVTYSIPDDAAPHEMERVPGRSSTHLGE